jgi:hypothetical protein
MSPRELAERESKPIALAWIDAAMTALRDEIDGELTVAALRANFRLSLRVADAPFVLFVYGTFARARDVLLRSAETFRDVSEDGARALFAPPLHRDIPPAYAMYGGAVYFTPRFEPFAPDTQRGFGPRCRAAMVLHESVHVIDPRSGEEAIHVSEWDEPRFSAQTREQAVRNPSAYASFAAQVHARRVDWPREARYGAGRRAD